VINQRDLRWQVLCVHPSAVTALLFSVLSTSSYDMAGIKAMCYRFVWQAQIIARCDHGMEEKGKRIAAFLLVQGWSKAWPARFFKVQIKLAKQENIYRTESVKRSCKLRRSSSLFFTRIPFKVQRILQALPTEK
jgi:hypothetical protein